ncbi:AIPR family protein [Sphingomonas bacterium]|uniref:AIPR family protein n=1 Tax=Sphingomonas bacterium TaxID=1895847 RepID=UPI0015756F7C|nr:AIPR family protein [Sphingomonas bacterium]
MDAITKANLSQFVTANGVETSNEDQQFESFSSYCVLSSVFEDSFDLELISTGSGDDCGIDALAIVVNGALVTDPEQVQDILDNNKYLDVQFFFIQSTTSSSFEGAKINTFFFGIEDFFKESPALPSNSAMNNARKIRQALYERAASFKRGNPDIFCYYASTGSWSAPQHTVAIIAAFKDRLQATNLLDNVSIDMLDAKALQKMYRSTQNGLKAEITIQNVLTLPPISGVDQAYLGYIPAVEYLKLITDEHSNIRKTVFYDNVRDFQGENKVNAKIATTLASDSKAEFIIRNNGVTVVAKGLTRTGDKFALTDFQIVNGCQTSHVLFSNSGVLDGSVSIPIRIVATESDEVTRGVIEATNSQTEVSDEQLRSLSDFQKTLEEHFATYDSDHRLYYERRSKQYASNLDIEKTRIVGIPSQIKSFGAIFLGDPHRAGRYFATLRKIHEDQLFRSDDKPETYYTSAYAHYRLEFLFRNNLLPVQYKAVRWLLLMTMRALIAKTVTVPPMNSGQIKKLCDKINTAMWNQEQAVNIFTDAIGIVQAAFTKTNRALDRDVARSQDATEVVVDELKLVLFPAT